MAQTKAQVLKARKDTALALFAQVLEQNDAIQTGDYKFVVELDGGYVEVALTAKDVITNDEGERVAYDPFIEVDRWEFDKADKAKRAAERARKHEEVLKRAEARKAKRAKPKAE